MKLPYIFEKSLILPISSEYSLKSVKRDPVLLKFRPRILLLESQITGQKKIKITKVNLIKFLVWYTRHTE